ncbi:AbrB/MazE/SpoVT family DNA-binding domain-containing protein [Vibrio anguillarum]|uniref:AbrB/MazE/SpoVT family DNA-binding domain-containing protein n=1 Tax=Vibrio TaxID=662 RepID=UPI00188BBB0A|nr:AbrB/MazE/SpoVT family DNA-binding domain-containing protein [Vibrio anguillarum]
MWETLPHFIEYDHITGGLTSDVITLTSVGNSTALTLPQAYLQQLGLHKGPKVNITLVDGKITIDLD